MVATEPSFEVRPATEADLDAMVELVVAVAEEGRWIGTEPPVDGPERRAQYAAAIERDSETLFVATAGGEVVGQLGLGLRSYGVAELGMLVAAAWRGRGVGSALLGAGLGWAREAGAHKVALQMWPHNDAARALYEKFGFVQEGLLRRHYPRRNGERWDAVVMGLLLDEGADGGRP